MIALALCTVLLLAGYFTYARVVDRIFGAEPTRPTPAMVAPDGVDTLPLPTWKVFLIQLLDIAGIGPVFGPILGALYGPVALVWIVLGTLFAGGVHDYFSGMLSIRHGGASLPEVVGQSMGNVARFFMRLFSVLLLVLVGVVFTQSPAAMISKLTGVGTPVLIGVIFVYYFFATILPIDKIIARLYLLFGALLVFMTFGVLAGLLWYEAPHAAASASAGLWPPAWTHPGGLPVWPLLFITLSCGAISGFHSTQSPIMARCLRSERHGRRVFYGAMVVEGFIALVWATAGMLYYPSAGALQGVISEGTPALVVNQVCHGLLGPLGGLVAIFGVIVLPITSGDTAFRSTRLILAEPFHLDQTHPGRRLLVAVPLFVVAWFISLSDFSLIWRYFGWSNQALSSLVLWTAAVWLARQRKFHWIASLPATFMTAVSAAFILQARIGFRLPAGISNVAGLLLALLALGFLLALARKSRTA
jgi:carbon starvation protein CstA